MTITESKYGRQIVWYPKPGETSSVFVDDYKTPREAHDAAWCAAIKLGYTAPKWWEYWRWSEQGPGFPSR